MNWEAIGAIGQVLGSFAVFVTLGYLAVQVGHARLEMRRTVFQGTRDALREIALDHTNNPQLIGLYARANTALGVQTKPTLHPTAVRYIDNLLAQRG